MRENSKRGVLAGEEDYAVVEHGVAAATTPKLYGQGNEGVDSILGTVAPAAFTNTVAGLSFQRTGLLNNMMETNSSDIADALSLAFMPDGLERVTMFADAQLGKEASRMLMELLSLLEFYDDNKERHQLDQSRKLAKTTSAS